MNREQVEKIFIKKYEKSDAENFLLLRQEMISEISSKEITQQPIKKAEEFHENSLLQEEIKQNKIDNEINKNEFKKKKINKTELDINDINGDDFINSTLAYLSIYVEKDEVTSYLAFDGSTPVGCGTICYYKVLPTLKHPTGIRAYILNIYTKKNYRRKGIAKGILKLLIEDAKRKGATLVTLEATEEGKFLYESCGFQYMKAGMEWCFNE